MAGGDFDPHMLGLVMGGVGVVQAAYGTFLASRPGPLAKIGRFLQPSGVGFLLGGVALYLLPFGHPSSLDVAVPLLFAGAAFAALRLKREIDAEKRGQQP